MNRQAKALAVQEGESEKGRRTSDDQRNGLEQVWETEQREAREKAEELAAKNKKELEAELKSAQDRWNHQSLELEKAWAMNADLVIGVCCTLRHETERLLLSNVALEQYLTPLIPRLFLVPRKRNCRIHLPCFKEQKKTRLVWTSKWQP